MNEFISLKTIRRTAYHEAGHAVAYYLLNGNIDIIDSVSIGYFGDDGMCKHTEAAQSIKWASFQDAPKYDTPEGFAYIFKSVSYSLAGGVAEMLYCGLKRLPKKAMEGDMNSVYDEKKLLVYEMQKREMDSLVATSIDFLKRLLLSGEAMVKIIPIADMLLKNGEDSEILQWKLYHLMGDEKNARKSRKRLREHYKLMYSK